LSPYNAAELKNYFLQVSTGHYSGKASVGGKRKETGQTELKHTSPAYTNLSPVVPK